MKINQKAFLLVILFATIFFNTTAFAKVKSAQDLVPDNMNAATVNGVTVRKGTIAAFIHNLTELEKVFINAPQSDEIESFKASLREAIPALNAVKLFDLVTIEDLLNAKHNNGKIYQAKVLTAAFYLQQFPQEITDPRINVIEHLKPQVIETVRKELSVVFQFKNKR